jgi:hypothetical protein
LARKEWLDTLRILSSHGVLGVKRTHNRLGHTDVKRTHNRRGQAGVENMGMEAGQAGVENMGMECGSICEVAATVLVAGKRDCLGCILRYVLRCFFFRCCV